LSSNLDSVLSREREYHEKLYSGFAQKHFARPAVRDLRAHMVQRILQVTGADRRSRVLSLGCGIGDTELLLAPHVRSVTGVDISGSAVRQARADAASRGLSNVEFREATVDDVRERFDKIIAIFFLHHLADAALTALPAQLQQLLHPGGIFYSLDPSRRRLSGAVGRVLVPSLMKKYQSADERELDPDETADLFRKGAMRADVGVYDFCSTPLAGLFPAWSFGYRMSRKLDDAILRIQPLSRLGSNFEIVARCP
jgi:SAM-dependent methyltransferase